MTRLDEFISESVRNGKLTVREAMAVDAAVRFCGTVMPADFPCTFVAFRDRYGSVSADGCRELRAEQSAPKPERDGLGNILDVCGGHIEGQL